MFRTLLLTLVSGCLFNPVFADWQVESATGSYMGLVPAMALDAIGRPHIVHSSSEVLWYSWHDGSQWMTEQLFWSPYGGVEGTDLVIDGEDSCHVSFITSERLYYSVGSSGSGFASEVIQPTEYSDWTSIGLDGNGSPVIASCSPYDHLSFISRSGSQWLSDSLLSEQSEGLETDCISLVMDSDFNPHMAFCSYAPQSAVMYAHRYQNEWHFSTVDSLLGNDPKGTSLALDDQANPHISYHTQTELRYAVWDGSSWQVEIVDAMDTGLRQYDTSLALDQYDNPHIAHVSPDGDSLLYSVDQGGGWTTESVCALPAYGGGDADLVLDTLGRPRVAFFEGNYMGLGYAWNDEPSGIVDTHPAVLPFQLAASPNPFTAVLSIYCTIPGGASADITIYDTSGRLVAELDAGSIQSVYRTLHWQPSASLSCGVYFVVLTSGAEMSVDRCLLLR